MATVDGRQHEVTAPAILMLVPGAIHGFRYAPDSAGHQVTIPTATLKSMLRGADQVEAQLADSFLLDARSLAAGEADSCSQMFDSLAAEFQESRPGRVQALLAQGTLIALWFLRHRGAQPADTRHRAMRDTLVQRLRTLVEAHFRDHRPLAFYATALQVTQA